MTHDYKPHGTTTLFAALSMLDGSVIAQCAPRNHYTEWLAFLRQIGREAPRDKALRLICDTYSTHCAALVPRQTKHFTRSSRCRCLPAGLRARSRRETA